MTSMDMLMSLSFLDDQLIDKALRTKTSDKLHAVRWNVIAACFGVMVLVGLLAVLYGRFFEGNTSDVPIQMESEPYEALDPTASTPSQNDEATDEITVTPTPEAEEVEEIQLPIITSYGDVEIDASYAVPQNGEFGYSEPLKEAMGEYKNDVIYKVFVDLFSDEFPVLSNSSEAQEEIDRLVKAGYTAELEITDDGTTVFYYFVLLASYEQLNNFDVHQEYGYMFFLYDERVGYVDSQTINDQILQNETGNSQQSESRSYEETDPTVDGVRGEEQIYTAAEGGDPNYKADNSQQSESQSYEEPNPINGGVDSEEQINTAVEEGEPEYVVIVCHDVGEPISADSITNEDNVEGCYLDPNDPNPDYDVGLPGYE